METELNLIPFYAMALSGTMIIREDIDKLYLKHKEEYYLAAKNSEFYNCLMAKENSLLTEEYFKKCLGFFVYGSEQGDEETAKGVYNLFKKAYKKTYTYYKNKESEGVDLKEYFKDMQSYLMKLDDDTANGNIMAIYFFTNCKCKNLDFFNDLLLERWQHYNGYRRISLDSMSSEREKEVNKYFKTVKSNIFDEILSSQKRISGYDFLYDIHELSSTSIFRELKFDKRDIKEMILAYLAAKELDEYDIEFDDYIIPALHLKAMCKAYNEVKSMYFENNKETMYVEMGSLRKELSKARSNLRTQETKIKQLSEKESNRNEELLEENIRLQNEIRELHNTIEKMESDSQEVVALREYFFRQEQDITLTNSKEIDLNELNKVNGMIVGGHPNWQNKMKEKLTNWKIIAAGVNTLDEKTIQSCDIIIFNTGHLNHSLYYKLIKIIKNYDIEIGYISSTNLDNSILEINNICLAMNY